MLYIYTAVHVTLTIWPACMFVTDKSTDSLPRRQKQNSYGCLYTTYVRTYVTSNVNPYWHIVVTFMAITGNKWLLYFVWVNYKSAAVILSTITGYKSNQSG